MTTPMGIMAAGFNFSAAAEDEFNDWYDTEHIPERLRVQGFINAERWIGVDNPKIAFATYDLDSIGVLHSAPYLAFSGANQSPWTKRIEHQMQKLGRFVGEQLVPGRVAAPSDAGGLLFFAMNVEPAAEAEFNQWYDTEHLPALAAVPGCLCARRFRAESDATQKYFAIYHLVSPDVATSKAWKAAVATPWTGKILKHTSAHLSARLRRYVRAGQAG